MKISASMEEIRKIRDENSLRHLSMTDEEISKENEEVMKWFADKIGRPIEILTAPNNIREVERVAGLCIEDWA